MNPRYRWQLAYKQRRTALGLCVDCAEPCAPFHRCAVHRAKNVAYQRRRTIRLHTLRTLGS